MTGDEESRRRAREGCALRRRLHFAQNLNCRRIDLKDLKFGRHLVEDTRTGERYRVYRGELLDAADLPISGWFLGPHRGARVPRGRAMTTDERLDAIDLKIIGLQRLPARETRGKLAARGSTSRTIGPCHSLNPAETRTARRLAREADARLAMARPSLALQRGNRSSSATLAARCSGCGDGDRLARRRLFELRAGSPSSCYYRLLVQS